MPEYAYNIVGCVLKIAPPDFDQALRWLKRVVLDMGEPAVDHVLGGVFEEILASDRLDLADRFYEVIVAEGFACASFSLLRQEHIDRKRKEDELRKRGEADRREREQREQRARELERQRQERIRIEETKRAEQVSQLRTLMTERFFDAHRFYRDGRFNLLSDAELQSEVAGFVRSWFEKNTPTRSSTVPDPDQALAVGADLRDTLVVARAGSGKTATIVNRAVFLSQHCGVNPDEMLLLAFNRKAARELRQRLEQVTGTQWPHVMTFHALAWAIVQPEEELLYNNEGDERLCAAVQEVIDEYLQDPTFSERVRSLMLARWRSNWEEIVSGGYDRTRRDFLDFRRALPRETLRGEYVKSHGEKVIANFLFEHDVGYKYEHPHRWDGRIYRPDFSHFRGGGGVAIEYFGLEGDAEYDAMSAEKRAYWDRRIGWELVEVRPSDLSRHDFDGWLNSRLGKCGMVCTRLDEDEVWARARKRAIDRFTRAVTQFILRARKLSLDDGALAGKLDGYTPTTSEEGWFLELVSTVFRSYLRRLKDAGEEDFDGLLARAAAEVEAGRTVFHRSNGRGDLSRMRFVFVDEYQDFSDLFFRMLSAIKSRNLGARLFCVGDDWQAINGFAGSDLTFFREFERLWADGQRLHLRTNYRSCNSVVVLGNALMCSTGGAPAVAHRTEAGRVMFADLAHFIPTEAERKSANPDEAALCRLVSGMMDKSCEWSGFRDVGDLAARPRTMVLLSRTNQVPWSAADGAGLDQFERRLRSVLAGDLKERVQVLTTHRFKGLQASVAVVVDEGRYPLVHPDWVFLRVLGERLEEIVEEERRLLYVAITRAEDIVVVVTDSSRRGAFLGDMDCGDVLDWRTLNRGNGVTGARVFVLVGNCPGRGTRPTYDIKDRLLAAGFRYSSVGWACWRTSVSAVDFDAEEFILSQSWAEAAEGVEVRVCDEMDEIVGRYELNRGRLSKLADSARRFATGGP